MAEHKPQHDAMESTSCWLEDQISKRLLAEEASKRAAQGHGLSAGSMMMSEAKQPDSRLLPNKNSRQFCAYRAKKITPFPKANLNWFDESIEEDENTATDSSIHEERSDCKFSKPSSGFLCGTWSCFSKDKDKGRPNDDFCWKKRDEQRNQSNIAGAFDERKKDNGCHCMVCEKNSPDLVNTLRIAGTNNDALHDDLFPRGDAYETQKCNFRIIQKFPQMTPKPNQVSCDSSRGTAKDGHCYDETSTKMFSPSHSILSSGSKMKLSDSSSQHFEVKRVSFRENAEMMQPAP